MSLAALATMLGEAGTLLAKHGELVDAVIQFAETRGLTSATMLKLLEDALKTASDAEMKAELGQ